jgi:hypothetical protein
MKGIKKFMISKYDETIKEPPYTTIKIDEMLVAKPELDNLGEEFAERIRKCCIQRGYKFRFYTISEDDKYDYEVVVY